MNEIETKFYQTFFQEIDKLFGFKYSREVLKPSHVIGIYKVDFLYRDIFVIEIDGYEFHKTKEQREHDYRRERYLIKNGFTVIRFTGTEIYLEPSNCIKELFEIEKEIEKRIYAKETQDFVLGQQFVTDFRMSNSASEAK